MKKASLALATILVILTSCKENKSTKETESTKQIIATDNPDSLIGKKAYVNPVDNKTYQTEGEFKEYHPDEYKKYDGPVQPLQIILLTDQNKIPAMINIDTLADFIKGADDVVIKQLAAVKDTGEILVQFTLFANKKAGIRMSYKGNLKTKDLTLVSNKLEAYGSRIRTKNDSCILQGLYGINEKKQ
ncbi:hypothetical protein A4H97_23530 [Niastella yeongjuensis]|uniref:Lipoprotein n=1 Tax=Niastella yeongjuensis TaxID=354355 RepID=A0A1V9F582_9BACT|nr:hypothetical protein [Niastella yeongjuensis]OQP53422.1 hypothetical protein A4H97_23530 [Niastella yeongjuensis]SEP12720.1 hypothetical protein SAMN05660816_04495 [Niastella yeongjuensis]